MTTFYANAHAHTHSFPSKDNPGICLVAGVMACGFFWMCEPQTCLTDELMGIKPSSNFSWERRFFKMS